MPGSLVAFVLAIIRVLSTAIGYYCAGFCIRPKVGQKWINLNTALFLMAIVENAHEEQLKDRKR